MRKHPWIDDGGLAISLPDGLGEFGLIVYKGILCHNRAPTTPERYYRHHEQLTLPIPPDCAVGVRRHCYQHTASEEICRANSDGKIAAKYGILKPRHSTTLALSDATEPPPGEATRLADRSY